MLKQSKNPFLTFLKSSSGGISLSSIRGSISRCSGRSGMTISAFSSSSSSASAPRSPFRQLLNNKTVAKDSSKDEKSPLPSTTPTSSVPSSTAPPSDGPKSPFRDPNASIFGDKIKNSFQRASEHQRQVNQKSSTSSSWNTNDRSNQPRRDQRQANQRIPFQQSRTETGSKDSKQQAKQQQPKIDPAQISGPDEDAESDAETLAAERAHLAPVYSGQARHEQKLVHLEHKRKEMAAKVPAIPPEPFKKPRKSPQSDELEEADLVDVPEDDLFEEVHDDYEAYIAKKKKLSQLPPEPAADTPTQPDHGKNFYSATGPLTVAELKRIAAERLQYRAEKLATIEPKVDYRELKKEKRHEKANLLKAKRAALREKLYGPKKVPTIIKEIRIPSNGLTVKELAMKLSRPVVDTIQELEKLGELVAEEGAENVLLEPDVIELLAMEFGLEAIREKAVKRNEDEIIKDARLTAGAELFPRAPIVAIMGHVDHGKTTLIDTLRGENFGDKGTPIAPAEAGGITQKLTAFEIELKSQTDRKVVFLDTPGHAAFSSMRKNGTLATDIAVILIAMDDGIRPQTIEAIKIAQKNECSLMIALNKIDKFPLLNDRQAMRRKILASLVEFDVLAEDLGGDVQVVELSGKTAEGIHPFLEKLCLQADLLDLKSARDGVSEGIVLDTRMVKGRGVLADVLIRWGTLRIGDPFVVNAVFGKVKAMENAAGRTIKEAGPSSVVKLLGLRSIPTSGYELLGVESESKARKIAERREKIEQLRLAAEKQKRSQEAEERGSPVTIHVIIKSESANGLQALQHIIDGVQKRLQGVSILVISSGVGTINQSDVNLAALSAEKLERASIIGFNIPQPIAAVRSLAKENDVQIYTNDVLYRLEEALEEVVKEHMPEERVLTVEGTAEVLQLFNYQLKGRVLKVAGLIVKTGHLKTSAKHVFRVKRPSVSSEGDKTYQTILEESADNAATLKRFKDTVHEVENGLECGFSIDGFEEFQVDDVIECCRIEMKAKSVLTKGAQTRETVGYGIQNKQNKQQSTTVATER